MNRNQTSHSTLAARAAGTLLALVGLASCTHAQVPSPPPVPPVPAVGATSSSSSWTMSTSEDGRTVTVSGKDGAITAEIDGKQVPADRIVHKGPLVQIKDDKGDVIWESEVPGSDSVATIYSGGLGSPRAIGIAPRARAGRLGSTLAPPGDARFQIQMDTPKVMIGIQMLDPDPSIRGHLGLKENESTMVGAIYEGLPAGQAGLEPYDVIVGVGGKSPAAPEAVRKALRETEPGKSVSFDVIHRGQKKTVTITVEKYDADKLEKAKVNAIAAANGAPSAAAIAGMPGENNNAPMAWSWSTGGADPFVGTIPGQGGKPGKAITLWKNYAGDNQELAEHLRALAEQAKEQAERAQEEAERMREQLQARGLGGGGNFGMGAIDMNKVMEERMKRMEEMMQKMMDQRNATPAPAAKKDDGKS